MTLQFWEKTSDKEKMQTYVSPSESGRKVCNESLRNCWIRRASCGSVSGGGGRRLYSSGSADRLWIEPEAELRIEDAELSESTQMPESNHLPAIEVPDINAVAILDEFGESGAVENWPKSEEDSSESWFELRLVHMVWIAVRWCWRWWRCKGENVCEQLSGYVFVVQHERWVCVWIDEEGLMVSTSEMTKCRQSRLISNQEVDQVGSIQLSNIVKLRMNRDRDCEQIDGT